MRRRRARLGETTAELNAEKESISSRLGSVQDQKYELEINDEKRDAARHLQEQAVGRTSEYSYIQAMEFRSRCSS